MNQLDRELRFHLVRFGRRLRWRDGWLLAQRWLWLACAAGTLIQLAGRLWPVERLWLWTPASLAAWLLIITAVSLLRPLPSVRVARRLDAELALKERLATALVLEDWEIGRLGDWGLEPMRQPPNLSQRDPVGPIYQSTNLLIYQSTNSISSPSNARMR